MTTLSRRGLLATTGALSLAHVLAACADTGADGKAVASSSASDADYDKAINSGPVAADDVVAASPWAASVKQAKKLVTGGTKTSEVFSWEDSKTKKISGFDAAIAQALARYIIGGDDARSLLEVQQVTSETRETVLTNGTVKAVIATYTITPERAKKIDFAGPYYASSQAILVKADNKDITGVDTLTGDVAVQSNSSSAAALKKYAPKATAKPFDTQAKCVAAVESGQVKAYVVDQSLLKSEVLSNDKVKIVGETFAADAPATVVPADALPADQMGLDIGPETRKLFAEAIATSKTVVWNGPMGVFEFPAFAEGTKAVAKAISESDAFSVIGGGDSAAAVRTLGFDEATFSHISTGGGASLELLEGKTLPGIAVLND